MIYHLVAFGRLRTCDDGRSAVRNFSWRSVRAQYKKMGQHWKNSRPGERNVTERELKCFIMNLLVFSILLLHNQNSRLLRVCDEKYRNCTEIVCKREVAFSLCAIVILYALTVTLVRYAFMKCCIFASCFRCYQLHAQLTSHFYGVSSVCATLL